VTNAPEIREVGAKNTPLKELNLAVNHDKKNKDTGEYERTGDTTWVTVKLWGDRASEDYRKGDLVEFDGTIVEKAFTRKDGTEGRRLESDYVGSIVVKFRKDGAPVASEEEPF
jgi:single-stranded DNA-binding protein